MCNTVSLYGNVRTTKNIRIASFINMTGTAHPVQQRHNGECAKHGGERQRCDETNVFDKSLAIGAHAWRSGIWHVPVDQLSQFDTDISNQAYHMGRTDFGYRNLCDDRVLKTARVGRAGNEREPAPETPIGHVGPVRAGDSSKIVNRHDGG